MAGLILSRYPHAGKDRILIGDNITITVTEVRSGSQVRLRIEAPPHVKVVREELLPSHNPQPLPKDNDTDEYDINNPPRR